MDAARENLPITTIVFANRTYAILKRHSLTYPELVQRLNDAGVEENERNLRNKVGRDEFSATFMLVCMKVMGAKVIPVEEWGWGGDAA
jgi:hypothetical protein